MADMFAMKPYTKGSEKFVEELVERLHDFFFLKKKKTPDPEA